MIARLESSEVSSSRAAEQSGAHAPVNDGARANLAKGAPEATYVANYSRFTSLMSGDGQKENAKLLADFSPVSQGANIRGISFSASRAAEYEFKPGSGFSEVTGSTQSSSRQLDLTTADGRISLRSEQSFQTTETGSTATLTNAAYVKDGNGIREGSIQYRVTDEPQTKKEAEKPKDEQPTDTAAKALYRNTSFTLASWSPNTPSGSVASKTFSASAGPVSGSVTFSTLGYDTNANASVSLQANALNAQVSVGADVYVAKVSASASLKLPGGVNANAQGSAEVGAGANGSAQAVIDPLKGEIDGNVDANAFVGAKAQGDVSADVAGADGTAQGSVGAGLGGDVNANVGFEHGKLNFDFGVQAYLGIGGGANFSLSIDPGQAVHDVENTASSVAHDVSSAWKSAISWL